MKGGDARDLGAVATEIRRQRQALGLTLTEVAESAQVSVAFLSMLEHGKQSPSFDRLERVRAALGVDSPPPSGGPTLPSPGSPILRIVGARLAAGNASLAELSRLADTTIREVIWALEQLRGVLQAVGIRVVSDGVSARLTPSPDSVRAPGPSGDDEGLVTLREDQYLALAVAAEYGALTRRQLDEIRGTDSHDLLIGIVEIGLLSSVVDGAAPGRPRVYRLTTRALELLGATSIQSLRDSLRQSGTEDGGRQDLPRP